VKTRAPERSPLRPSAGAGRVPALGRPADLPEQFRQIQEINALLERRVEARSRELRESELKFRTIVENAYDWERWDSPGGAIIHTSRSCERITGYPPEAFEGQPGMLDRIIHPQDLARWKAHYDTVHAPPEAGAPPTGPACETDLRIIRADGGIRWVEHTCHPIFDPDGSYRGRRVKVRDITEAKQAEKERERLAALDRFNRTQQAIIECNRVIIRARDEQELLQEFCRIAMKVHGVHQAWVGLAAGDAARSIRPAAAMGLEPGSLGRLSWADAEPGQTPAGIAIRTGEVCIRALETVAGPGSSIALPLLSDRQAFGVLVLNSLTPDTFIDEPGQMLLELANNLAIGILELRIRAERDQALRTAERQAEQLRSLALELAQTEQRERRLLAQLLHDQLQQLLVGATFSLETLDAEPASPKAREILARLGGTIREAIRVARVLTVELSPPVVREKPLAPCLEWLARQFQANHGLRVALDLDAELTHDPEPVRMFIFEAVRELLLNVVKHARVATASLRLRILGEARLEITVADPGAGFDPAILEAPDFPAEGVGLFSLLQRLQFLKGSLEIASSPGTGSRLTMIVPILWPGERRSAAGAAHEEGGRDARPDPDRG